MPSNRVLTRSTDAGTAAPVARAVATAWRVVASLAVLAGIWTVAQLALAVQAGGTGTLLPSALIAYAAGIGYLASTAAIALRFDKLIRAGRALRHSWLLGIAHATVVGSAVLIGWRGVTARGVLVGLGASLVGWAVVAILALATDATSWLIRRQLEMSDHSAPAGERPVRSIASACLACVAVLGLGLAYLESQPLPNLPEKPHLPSGLEAGNEVPTDEKSAGLEEPALGAPTAPAPRT